MARHPHEPRRYDDYGNPDAVSAFGNPYLFQGRRFDAETGFYYYRNRYYDPANGRFLQRDPVWDEDCHMLEADFRSNGTRAPPDQRLSIGLTRTRRAPERNLNGT